ncbi:hypothetical protein GGP91_003250 [Salinibacter ruber]|nr:hypothetical protein [Salinibacter ruber]MCS4057737.1 hypothetical protein [Salinibacter ruber]MCS4162773.1 hypothetical protein [Salinibacter ruber]
MYHPERLIQSVLIHGGSSKADRPRWTIQNGCMQEWLAAERGRRGRPEASRDGQRRRQESAPQTLWVGAGPRGCRHVTVGSIQESSPITSTPQRDRSVIRREGPVTYGGFPAARSGRGETDRFLPLLAHRSAAPSVVQRSPARLFLRCWGTEAVGLSVCRSLPVCCSLLAMLQSAGYRGLPGCFPLPTGSRQVRSYQRCRRRRWSAPVAMKTELQALLSTGCPRLCTETENPLSAL